MINIYLTNFPKTQGLRYIQLFYVNYKYTINEMQLFLKTGLSFKFDTLSL